MLQMGSQIPPGCRVQSGTGIKINTWQLRHDNAFTKDATGGSPSGGVHCTDIKGGNWSLCVCVSMCVGLSAHSVYIDVDCCCNVQASSFFLPEPGWMTVSRLRYSIFGSRARLPCKLSDLNGFKWNAPVLHFGTHEKLKSVDYATKWTQLLGSLLTAEGMEANEIKANIYG